MKNFIRILLISLMAIVLVACKGEPEFSVTPEPVKAGEVATFDATVTDKKLKKKTKKIVSYDWDFGDGSSASGITATHTFSAPGIYTVRLTVMDKKERMAFIEEEVVVIAGSDKAPLNVIVQLAGGVSLAGANVRIGSVTAVSNADGIASFAAAPIGSNQVITVSKTGHVTQALRTTVAAASPTQQALALMLPEKDNLSIAQIGAAQIIESNYLGAKITIPANAFVNAVTGAPAVGSATLKLTPWDISSIDMQAMLGNGRALVNGSPVDLISSGMMTVKFFDLAGNALQVANGKQVGLQMDVPQGVTSIGTNTIAAGLSVPLWFFDEGNGLWAREGTGTYVATSNGLAVSATVSHFSSWNWDYVVRPVTASPGTPSQLNVSCVDSNNQLVACSVVAQVFYPGSSRYWSGNLAAAVTPVLNMPAGSTIKWEASTADGLRGSITSTDVGNVVIRLQPPSTNNFVQCVTTDNTQKACNVKLLATSPAGITSSYTFYIPEGGASVKTYANASGQLNWSADTGYAPTAGSTWTNFSGTASSTLTGTVTIVLQPVVVSGEKIVTVRCSATGTVFLSASLEPVTNCSIEAYFYDASDTFISVVYISNGVGAPVSVAVPNISGGFAFFRANGYNANTESSFVGSFQSAISDLTYNQAITIEMVGSVPN